MATTEVALLQFRPAYDVLAYCALSGNTLASNFSIENLPYPTLLACSQLPCLRVRHQLFVPRDHIIDYLKQNYFNLDAGLSQRQLFDLRSVTSLIQHELHLALEVAMYDDEEHWWKVTYRQLIQALAWPFSRIVARKLRREALQRLDAVPFPRGERLPKWAVPSCDSAYKIFNERLASAEWLLGVAPTSADAILFGHVAQAKFEPGLSESLKNYPFIEAHFERVLERVSHSSFFSLGVLGFKGPDIRMNVTSTIPAAYLRAPAPDKPKTEEEELEQKRGKMRTEGIWQALSFALVAVMVYTNFNWLGRFSFQVKTVEDAAEPEMVMEGEE
jgi:glutathione S-transferase